MKRKSKPKHSAAAPPPAPPSKALAPTSHRPRLRWLFRLGAMTLVPLALLGLAELGLRLAGYGYNPDFFVPLRIGSEDYWVQNENFSRRFFPGDASRQPGALRMTARKAPGTVRLFVLGESAAMGDPEPAYGPARYLEVLLRTRHPDREFEVINVAFTAINSHVILPIARECARHDADAWIIYMGNNEMVGPFGAATVFGAQSPPRTWVKLSLALQRTRLGQLASHVGRTLRKQPTDAAAWQGMQMFLNNRVAPDSPKRFAAIRNFAGNLDEMLQLAGRRQVPVLLNTVAVNLHDSPPFATWPNTNLTLADSNQLQMLLAAATTETSRSNWTATVGALQAALKLDAANADLHFKLAGALAQAGDATNSLIHYQQACDLDALPFRTDSRLNNVISNASHAATVSLLNSAAAISAQTGRRPCGHETFHEHVHFNFDGAYQLGRAWTEHIEKLLPLGPPLHDWPSRSRCDELLGLSAWNRKVILESMVRRLQEPPLNQQPNNADRIKALEVEQQRLLNTMTPDKVQQTRTQFTNAINAHPNDHYLREGYATFQQLTGDLPGALREWQTVGQLLPHDFLPHFQSGVLLARMGRHDEAQTSLRQALGLRPALTEGWLELARSYNASAQWQPALTALQQARRFRPQDAGLCANEAKLRAQLGQTNEAVLLYRQAIALNPAFAEAHAALGESLLQAGRVAEATEAFAAAVRLRPGFVAARLNLAVLLARLGQRDEAVQQVQAVLQLEPANALAADLLRQLTSAGEVPAR